MHLLLYQEVLDRLGGALPVPGLLELKSLPGRVGGKEAFHPSWDAARQRMPEELGEHGGGRIAVPPEQVVIEERRAAEQRALPAERLVRQSEDPAGKNELVQ